MRSSHNISCLRVKTNKRQSYKCLITYNLYCHPHFVCEKKAQLFIVKDLYICKDEMCLALSEIWCQKLLQLESDQKKLIITLWHYLYYLMIFFNFFLALTASAAAAFILSGLSLSRRYYWNDL